jgi:hypothetical protein
MKGGIYHMKNINRLETFDVDPHNDLHSEYLFNNRNEMDYDWIRRQINYMNNNLSDRHKHIIRSYTKYGDVFVNNYLRGTLSDELIDKTLATIKEYNLHNLNQLNPFMIQHKRKTGRTSIDELYRLNIIEYVRQYIAELRKIIDKSPRLSKNITLFRGVENPDYLLQSYNESSPMYFIEKGFMSTTFRIDSAVQFSSGPNSCIFELHVSRHTPCLLTGHISDKPGEFEIMLVPNMVMSSLTPITPILKYVISDSEFHMITQSPPLNQNNVNRHINRAKNTRKNKNKRNNSAYKIYNIYNLDSVNNSNSNRNNNSSSNSMNESILPQRITYELVLYPFHA